MGWWPVDDMVSAEEWEHAQNCFDTLKGTLKLMGAVEAEHKSVSPNTKMVCLGMLFGTEKLTLEADMAACVRPGRLCMSRLLEFLRGMPKGGKVKVAESVRRDRWW